MNDKPNIPELGPQHTRDTQFTARMRLHQSWWRAVHLKVRCCGTGPTSKSETPYGSMLQSEDGDQGLNFLTKEIFAVAKERLSEQKGVVEPFRLLNNLLSSQPMCFNLFGPLVKDYGLAKRLLGAILPGEITKVLTVKIEYAPEPASEYLADSTAFDAFIAYRRPDGQNAFIGFETKLTEPFSQKRYDDKPGCNHYRRWMTKDGPWLENAWVDVADMCHNQLWRDHLLAIALRRHPEPETSWAFGRLALIRHPLDLECGAVTAGYKSLLRADDKTFIDLPLDQLVAKWSQVVQSPAEQQWLEAFRLRYLDLEASGS